MQVTRAPCVFNSKPVLEAEENVRRMKVVLDQRFVPITPFPMPLMTPALL